MTDVFMLVGNVSAPSCCDLTIQSINNHWATNTAFIMVEMDVILSFKVPSFPELLMSLNDM